MSESLWRKEFPETYNGFFEARLLRDGWTDVSWHNDVAASFEKQLSVDITARLWIQSELPEEREIPGSKRYQLTFQVGPDKEHVDAEPVELDSLMDALDVVSALSTVPWRTLAAMMPSSCND